MSWTRHWGTEEALLSIHRPQPLFRSRPKQILSRGESKNLVTERVIFAPDPAHEVEVVQRISHEFANEHRSLRSIATRLNSDRIRYSP